MTTHDVPLPGLGAIKPVDFLASVGLLRVLAQDREIPARLRWERGMSLYHPVLVSPLPDIDAIAGELQAAIDAIPEGSVLPGVTVPWPAPRKPGIKGDPGQLLPGEAVHTPQPGGELSRPVMAEWVSANPAVGPWLRGCLCLTPSPAQIQAGTRLLRSPYIARRGQQSIRTFFEVPLEYLRRNPDCLAEGLRQPHRYRKGLTGEGLDHHSYVDPSNSAPLEAMPAATWLATIALPLLPVSATPEGVATAPLWFHSRAHDGGPQWRMVWPIWTQPLGIHGLENMLTLPYLNPTLGPTRVVEPDLGGDPYDPVGQEVIPANYDPLNRWNLDPDMLSAYHIVHVGAAARMPIPGLKYDLPLTPIKAPEFRFRLTARQAAERAGVSEPTWRAYGSRGYAPPPDHKGRPVWWWSNTVDKWFGERPGQGKRS